MKKAKAKQAKKAEKLETREVGEPASEDPSSNREPEILETTGPVGSAAAEQVAAGQGAEVPTNPQGEPADAEDPIEALTKKVAGLEDSLLRAKADYQNLQRRHAVERAETIRYANAELMRSLVAVADDFDRSLAAAEESGSEKSIVDGLRLLHENFLKAMRDHGLESIEALNTPFDPHVHQAMMQQPCADHPPGTVLQEVARGYRLRDRVIRPAKVIVSTAVAREEPDQPVEQGAGTNESEAESGP